MLDLHFKSQQASSRGPVLNFRMWSGIQPSLMSPCIVTAVILFFFFFLLLSSFEMALVWGGGKELIQTIKIQRWRLVILNANQMSETEEKFQHYRLDTQIGGAAVIS